MTVAAGHDLVFVPEFRRLLRPRFIERAYTAAEVTESRERSDPAAYFASRWAAKEAAYKALCDLALRSGRTTDGLACFRDYEVVRRLGSRVPALAFHGEAARLLAELEKDGHVSVSISLTDEHEYAGAFVVVGATRVASGTRVTA
ncbi:MAG TPA: holo-ACP synthase [Chloroflexota bacterium]|nr:holo-ACP synthase [Chloroflexota bacterium]